MNITILANQDLASNIALNYLIPRLQQHRLTIFLSDQVGASDAKKPQQLVDLKFFEQRLFNEIIFPNIDNHRTPDQSNTKKPHFLTFKALGKLIECPIKILNHINQPAGLAELRKTNPDLILSIRFGKILQQEAISSAKKGVLNLHSGLLPHYQGVMATFWAMLNQDKEYGTTLHFIDTPAIDAGPIISQAIQPLKLNLNYLENVLNLYPPGCQQMISAVNQLATDEPLTTQPQLGKPHYFTFPDEQHLKTFINHNMRLFSHQQIIELSRLYQVQFLE